MQCVIFQHVLHYPPIFVIAIASVPTPDEKSKLYRKKEQRNIKV
jgi:hypothetical protein